MKSSKFLKTILYNFTKQETASSDIFLDHLNERKNEAAHDVNEITIDEVLKAISKLNVESAPGSDGITSNVYKIFKRELAPLLQGVFNNIDRTEKGSRKPTNCDLKTFA